MARGIMSLSQRRMTELMVPLPKAGGVMPAPRRWMNF